MSEKIPCITEHVASYIKAIDKGYNTNKKLAEYLKAAESAVSSTTARLRKAELIIGRRDPSKGNLSQAPYIYSRGTKEFTIGVKRKAGRYAHNVSSENRRYAEKHYDNLNFYLYPFARNDAAEAAEE